MFASGFQKRLHATGVTRAIVLEGTFYAYFQSGKRLVVKPHKTWDNLFTIEWVEYLAVQEMQGRYNQRGNEVAKDCWIQYGNPSAHHLELRGTQKVARAEVVQLYEQACRYVNLQLGNRHLRRKSPESYATYGEAKQILGIASVTFNCATEVTRAEVDSMGVHFYFGEGLRFVLWPHIGVDLIRGTYKLRYYVPCIDLLMIQWMDTDKGWPIVPCPYVADRSDLPGCVSKELPDAEEFSSKDAKLFCRRACEYVQQQMRKHPFARDYSKGWLNSQQPSSRSYKYMWHLLQKATAGFNF